MVKRLGYYLIGVVLGTMVVMGIFGGRDIGCNYAPNARVIDNLSKKQLTLSALAQCQFECLESDSSYILNAFESGDVDFDRSITDSEKCNTYFVSIDEPQKTTLVFENCDSTATLLRMEGGWDCGCEP